MKKITAFLLAMMLLFPGITLCEGHSSPADILAGLTTEQKVAQLLMPAFYYRTNQENERIGVTEIYPENITLVVHPTAI